MTDRMTFAEVGLEVGRTWHQIHGDVMSGRLKGGKDEAGWWVSRESLERFKAARAELQAGVEVAEARDAALTAGDLAPDEVTAIEAWSASAGPAVRRIHLHGVGIQVELNSFEADAREAEGRGYPTLADTIRKTAAALRAARYRFNGSTWIMEVPAVEPGEVPA